MSGGALFGNNASRSTPKNLVEFKAGKMTMKGKMVYPDIRKGQLYVYQSDDSLMHFCWKDRVSGYVEDDLIIFPDDCEFKHVPQCKTGRVYLLRFKSSNKKFFVWLQDLKTDKDEEYCRKINEVLNNPPTPGSQRSGSTNPEGDLQNLLNNMSQQQLMQLFGGVGQIGLGSLLGTMNRPQGVQSTRASTTTASTRVTTNTSRPTTQMVSSSASANDSPKTNGDNKSSSRTSDTSTSGSTTNTNNKIQLSDLQNFLSEIPTTTGTESVVQSGQAGPVIRQFGLGPDAVNAAASGNIEEFVTALESEAKSGQEQTQQGQEDKNTKQAPPTSSPDKKGDDDEGLDLD
ncbi:proteasomal ubiquitin receptor ADRM1 homolog isoform X2 [Apis mellifera]|uniref:Proteasomal ubiquitin receptor ADRM1 homolog n=1 Tax=Apis mellifera TaxID=7460 RepID=A0A7M7LQ39_APIME|nr:proteasomal ubiquitin receptor ADRM1 homolog isoform X2 [Apis mellifera]|eukprot:XP_006571832.1 proteasomal ubiquitin receptor ADRM1 homolog isoform X2 [Apis mellifera]